MEVIENAKPQKKHFRQRAHSNPLADHSFIYPVAPNVMNWQPFYPHYFTADGSHSTAADPRKVEILDIGCGYGGMCIALAPLFPELLILGMEIRVKVSAFVNQRILALREQNKNSSKNQEKAVQENDNSKQNIDSQNTPVDHNFQNVSVIRTNAMKYMTNFFHKGQLKKMFFLFPDPHFKQKKHKWRIISETLLAEYAYVMAVGGIVYTMTDVADLHEWMTSHFTAHPLFERITAEEYANDPVVEKLYDSTEEGQKVTRNKGDKFLAIFRRIEDPFVVTSAEC